MGINVEHKILKMPIRIALSVFIIGLMFKIMHWPFSGLIVLLSCAAIIVLYALRFLNKKQKKTLDYVKLILVTSWALNAIFTINHFPYKIIFGLLFSSSFVIWLVLGGYQDYFNKGNSTIKYLRGSFFWIAMIITLIGVMFKIMHWPGAGPMLIVGLGLSAFWFIIDFFKK